MSLRSYYELTPEERERIAMKLDLLDSGGAFGIAVRFYRDQERSLARTPKGAPR